MPKVDTVTIHEQAPICRVLGFKARLRLRATVHFEEVKMTMHQLLVISDSLEIYQAALIDNIQARDQVLVSRYRCVM